MQRNQHGIIERVVAWLLNGPAQKSCIQNAEYTKCDAVVLQPGVGPGHGFTVGRTLTSVNCRIGTPYIVYPIEQNATIPRHRPRLDIAENIGWPIYPHSPNSLHEPASAVP